MGIYRRKNRQGKHYGPWYIQYPDGTDSSTGKTKYACKKVGFSKRQAERALARKILDWQERKLVGPEGRKAYLFWELADWYESLPAVTRAKSSHKIRQHCVRLKAGFGHLMADEIKPSMIEAYQQKRLSEVSSRGTPYRPASVNREIEVMRRIYNLAVREDMAVKNPCWKVTRLPEQNARDRVLSPEEWERLLKALPRHAADIATAAYNTGMRVGEITGLTWDRVNMKEGCFNLTPEDTKTGEGRHVYFNGEVREVLERLGKARSSSHNFVFTYNGKPLKSIKTCFATALKKAKIRDFRFHDLRHTFNTNLRKAGVDRTVIMKLTGHKTLSMFLRYSTVDERDAREAMEKFGDFIVRRQKSTAKPTAEAKKGQATLA